MHCGYPADPRVGLCPDCIGLLPRNHPACPLCALPLPDANLPACGACLRRAPAFDHAVAPLRYEGVVRLLVQRLKFSGDLAAVRPLAAALESSLAARPVEWPLPEQLLPVPLHRQRLAERGFNQAERLARMLSRRLSLPLSVNSLQRSLATQAQATLDARARRRNVRGAFAVVRSVPEHVAIVDDVVTTGSTAGEIARLLRLNGCRRVEVWAAARAPAP